MSTIRFEPTKVTLRIYQGGWPLPQLIPGLIQMGITHILNLDLPYPDPFPFLHANITLQNLYIMDACILKPQIVREAIELIEKTLSVPRNKLYIHCNAGVSRSPTVAWLYLIYSGLSPEDAKAIIQPDPLIYNNAIVKDVIIHRSRPSVWSKVNL